MHPATGDFDASVRKISARVMQSPGCDPLSVAGRPINRHFLRVIGGGDISCVARRQLFR